MKNLIPQMKYSLGKINCQSYNEKRETETQQQKFSALKHKKGKKKITEVKLTEDQ